MITGKRHIAGLEILLHLARGLYTGPLHGIFPRVFGRSNDGAEYLTRAGRIYWRIEILSADSTGPTISGYLQVVPFACPPPTKSKAQISHLAAIRLLNCFFNPASLSLSLSPPTFFFMSGDEKQLFHYDSFIDPYSFYSHYSGGGSGVPQDFEPTPQPYAGFTEYLQSSADYGMLSKAFDLSFTSKEEAFEPVGKEMKRESDIPGVSTNENSSAVGGVGIMSATANSSPSSSSVEVAGEEDYGGCEKDIKKNELVACEEENGGLKDKNITKPKKKGEKSQREPRFAFMTKSEVDHLEDGYRWRKYGQKAVKNSPYPRSYYRCTTQKCTVKKRVERSNQDPSIVITTYEGQHTHHCPANVRGSSHLLANQSSAMAMPSLRAELFGPQFSQFGLANPSTTSGYEFLQTLASPSQQLQIPNYGALLQDINLMSSFIKSSQP